MDIKSFLTDEDNGTLVGLRDMLRKAQGYKPGETVEDPPVESSGTAKVPNMADGGDVSDALQQALSQLTSPFQAAAMPAQAAGRMGTQALDSANPVMNMGLDMAANRMNAQMPGSVEPDPNATLTPDNSQPPMPPTSGGPSLSQATQTAQNSPSTNYDFYKNLSADDRMKLYQQLTQQQHSGGNLAASALGGLGDAISNSFGKGGANSQKDIMDRAEKAKEGQLNAFDTERGQKLQDTQANTEMSMNDPNSAMAQSMRKTLQSAGLQVPSGMSANVMLKVAGPLGELALHKAQLAETSSYHDKEMNNNAANRNAKLDEYASEHPILNYLNPVDKSSPSNPVSNPNAPGHGVPDLGSTFNGQKVLKVTRIN